MHTCLDLEDDVFLGNMAVLAFYFSVSFWEWKFRQKMFLGHNCPSEVIFVFKLSVWECKNMFSGRNQHLQQLLFFWHVNGEQNSFPLGCQRATTFIPKLEVNCLKVFTFVTLLEKSHHVLVVSEKK